MNGEKVTPEVITTGVTEVDMILDGGIRTRTLSLIEGQLDSGKSVLCQHLIHGTLHYSDKNVAYYTTENSIRSLIAQMGALSLSALDYFLTDRLRIYPIPLCNDWRKADINIQILTYHLLSLPERFNVVIIDTITLLMTYGSPVSILNFFLACKDLTEQGRTVLLVVHSDTFSKKMLPRIISMCDVYLTLKLEEIGSRIVRVMEIIKHRGARPFKEAALYFEVKHREGIKELPYAKAKAKAV